MNIDRLTDVQDNFRDGKPERPGAATHVHYVSGDARDGRGPHVVAPECPHHGALLLLVLHPVMSKAVTTRLSALGRLIT